MYLLEDIPADELHRQCERLARGAPNLSHLSVEVNIVSAPMLDNLRSFLQNPTSLWMIQLIPGNGVREEATPPAIPSHIVTTTLIYDALNCPSVRTYWLHADLPMSIGFFRNVVCSLSGMLVNCSGVGQNRLVQRLNAMTEVIHPIRLWLRSQADGIICAKAFRACDHAPPDLLLNAGWVGEERMDVTSVLLALPSTVACFRLFIATIGYDRSLLEATDNHSLQALVFVACHLSGDALVPLARFRRLSSLTITECTVEIDLVVLFQACRELSDLEIGRIPSAASRRLMEEQVLDLMRQHLVKTLTMTFCDLEAGFVEQLDDSMETCGNPEVISVKIMRECNRNASVQLMRALGRVKRKKSLEVEVTSDREYVASFLGAVRENDSMCPFNLVFQPSAALETFPDLAPEYEFYRRFALKGRRLLVPEKGKKPVPLALWPHIMALSARADDLDLSAVYYMLRKRPDLSAYARGESGVTTAVYCCRHYTLLTCDVKKER